MIIIINDRLKKGRILEFLLKDKSKIPKEDDKIWYGKYIYPANISMNE